jgi:hypothetical protein
VLLAVLGALDACENVDAVVLQMLFVAVAAAAAAAELVLVLVLSGGDVLVLYCVDALSRKLRSKL